MTSYVRLAGAVVVLVAVFVIGREYAVFSRRRIKELRGFYELLKYMESSISSYLSFGSELWGGFSCEGLKDSGFLASLRECELPGEAFSKCRPRLSFSEEYKDLVEDFFRGFGREYRDGELKRIAEYKEKLGNILALEEESTEKNVKVARALLLGGGLSLVVLVI